MYQEAVETALDMCGVFWTPSRFIGMEKQSSQEI